MNKKFFNVHLKSLWWPISLLSGFVLIAIWRWWATGKTFYLYNFTYIGASVALGIFLLDNLARPYKLWGRRIAQVLVGSYMLVYVGFGRHENMQIEGFFFYLFLGVFAGASLHYLIAKVFGPLIFGRAWCGWACWTAMVLDLFPWKRPEHGRLRHVGIIRYVYFGLALALVGVLFFGFGYTPEEKSSAEVYWLAIGNALYYLIAIMLAARLKDNRAFCKYVCPIPVTQKIGARFAMMKLKVDPEKCIECGLCEKQCPMDINILDYMRNRTRILSTECVMCVNCANICPQDAISYCAGFDGSFRDSLTFTEK